MQPIQFTKPHTKNYSMKKTIYLLLIIASAAFGCKKDSALKSLQQQLSGTWELTKTFGGWSGETGYLPGNGNTIAFEKNNYTKHFVSADTSYTMQGVYGLYENKLPCDSRQQITQIVFDSTTNGDFAEKITISNGELSIGNSECIADGSMSFYRRIK